MIPSDLLRLFSSRWDTVPLVVIDTETTGTRPGHDGVCQFGIVRFESRQEVGRFVTYVDPCCEIPESAIAVHGITNDLVRGAPSIEQVIGLPEVERLFDGAQPAAYCAGFDRAFLPPHAIPHVDHSWPWLDGLSVVRAVDRFARGKGRHKLSVAAQRHGVALPHAHSAEADARAAGELIYRTVPKLEGCEAARKLPAASELTLGQLLCWQRIEESREWYRFIEWVAAQPPMEASP